MTRRGEFILGDGVHFLYAVIAVLLIVVLIGEYYV